MKRLVVLLAVLLALFVVSHVSVFAQRGRGSGAGVGRNAGAGTLAGPRGGLHQPGNTTARPHGHGESHTTSGPKTPGELLAQNTRLSDNLKGLLPGVADIQAAAGGFENLGQFVAAVHVSHNLRIPFDDLKARMLDGKKLGEAIHELKPEVDAKAEARRAEKQAKRHIKEAGA